MLVHEESKSLLLRVRNPALVQEVIPHHRLIDFQGHNIAVRHDLESARVLRNMGIPAPSPILHYYNWPGRHKPWAHQKDTAHMLTLYRRMFVLNETGTAKTASALWAADYLMQQGKVRKVLVASKLSTLERVWLEEIFSVLMHRRAAVLHGTKEKRLELLAADLDFYIINHEGLGVIRNELAKRDDIDLIILDEASEYRNGQTNKYACLNGLLKPTMRVWPMTATPCPNAPTDAYSLAKLVDKTRVPNFFGQFKRATMLQVTQYKWVPKPEAYHIAFNAMQPAVRYRKVDCLDLPPMVVEERSVELSAEQQKTYDTMRIHMVIENGLGSITAINAADKINKLRQILCGAVKNTEDGTYSTIDHAPRLKVLLECIQEADAKVIVIVPFKGIIEALETEIKQHYSCAVLNGDVSPARRNKIILEFKSNPDPHVLLCHPKVMAHGLNLTEADMMIFYAPIYSNDEAMQVIERINRPGQTRKMTVIRMGANALEWGIFAMLDGKQEGQESILELYNTHVRGQQ